MKKTRKQLKADVDRLKRTVQDLRRENEKLAAGQCPDVIGDDGGSPQCRFRGLLYRAMNDFAKIRKSQEATMPSEPWQIEVDIAFALMHKTIEPGT